MDNATTTDTGIRVFDPMDGLTWVLCDLDNTIALTHHRQHFVREKHKDWDAFFAACVDDPPNQRMIELLRTLTLVYPICIVSGRSDIVLRETEEWLANHGVPYDELIMRKHEDNMPDDELKKSWAIARGWSPNNVAVVFDDRDKLVAMWRSLGLFCCQVAYGDF